MHLIGTWVGTSKNSLLVASYIKQLAQGGFSEAGKGYPFPVGVFQISHKLLNGFALFSTTLNLITISNCSPIFKSLGLLKLFYDPFCVDLSKTSKFEFWKIWLFSLISQKRHNGSLSTLQVFKIVELMIRCSNLEVLAPSQPFLRQFLSSGLKSQFYLINWVGVPWSCLTKRSL